MSGVEVRVIYRMSPVKSIATSGLYSMVDRLRQVVVRKSVVLKMLCIRVITLLRASHTPLLPQLVFDMRGNNVFTRTIVVRCVSVGALNSPLLYYAPRRFKYCRLVSEQPSCSPRLARGPSQSSQVST